MGQLTREYVVGGGIVPGVNLTGSTIPAKRIVKYDAANGKHAVALATAATDKFVGITENDIPTSNTGDLRRMGKQILTSGGTVSIGDRITSDGSGKGIATTTEDNSVIGEAVTATTGADQDFEVRLTPGNHVP